MPLRVASQATDAASHNPTVHLCLLCCAVLCCGPPQVLVYKPVTGTEFVANHPGVVGVTSAEDVADDFWKLYSDPASPVSVHRET